MSHIPVSSLRRPSPFQFPSLPLDVNPGASGSFSALAASSSNVGDRLIVPESSTVHSAPIPEIVGERSRKTSSITYHSAGLKEFHERKPQRTSKAFIIVIPPVVLAQGFGQLGSTLSVGPSHRLSQGLIMPLLSTVSLPWGQKK